MARTLDFSLQLKANNDDLRKKVNEVVQLLNQLRNQIKQSGVEFKDSAVEFKAAAAELKQFEAALRSTLKVTKNNTTALNSFRKAAKDNGSALSDFNKSTQNNIQNLSNFNRLVKNNAQALDSLGHSARTNGQALNSLGHGGANLEAVLQGLAASMNRNTQALNNLGATAKSNLGSMKSSADAVPSSLTPIASGVQGIGKSLLGLAAGVASIAAVKQGIDAVLSASMEMDKIKTRFEYAFGGADEAARQLDFVKQTATDLGLEFVSTAQGYSQLASATKDLNITNEQTQQIFKGVASAAATMGLSADETSGVILALSQIAGKGKVSMEELRGQLGERLTPAMSIAAKAMGVTTAELEKMVEKGLPAEEFLPKFGAALEEAFGNQAAKNVESLSGQINLLKNQFNDLLVDLGSSGMTEAAVAVVSKLGEAISWVREQMHSVDATQLKEAFADMATTLQTAFDSLVGTLSDVFTVLNNVGNAFSPFGDLPETMSGAEAAVARLAQTMNFLNGAVNGVMAAFNAVGGVVSLAFAGALQIVNAIATGLNALGVVSDETVKQVRSAAESSMAAADGMFERSKAAFEAGGASMAKAFEDQTATVQTAAQQAATAAEQSYTRAAETAKKKGEEAAAAQKAAIAAVGTAGEEAARVQAMNAQLAADNAENAALIAKQKWQDSYAVLKAESAESAKSVAFAMETAGVAVSATAEKTQQLAKETAAADEIFKVFGVNISAAMNKPSKAVTDLINQLPQLQTALSDMGANAQATGEAIKQAFTGMVKKAETSADIDAIKAKLEEMKTAGVMSVGQVADVTEDLNKKLKNVAGATDETSKAFENLGIKSKAALKEAAEQMQQDFQTVKESGQATTEELKKAFEKVAKAAIDSGDNQAIAWAKSEAAAQGYNISVDKTGSTVVQKTTEATTATDNLTAAYERSGQAAVTAYGSATNAAQNYTKAAQQAASATSSSSDVRKTGQSNWRQSETQGFVQLNNEQMATYLKKFGGVYYGAQAEKISQQSKAYVETIAKANNLTTTLGNFSGYADMAALNQARQLVASESDKLGSTLTASLRSAIASAEKELQSLSSSTSTASSYTPKTTTVSTPTTSTTAGKTVNLNLSLGSKTVQAAVNGGNANVLEQLIKELEQSKRASGF